MKTTEEVSSRGVKKRVKRRNWQRNTRVPEKTEGGLEKDLQICGAGGKSRNSPALVVGMKP